MASNPITSWQIYAGKVEIVAGFTFLGSKITADGDCSHRIKRRLPLGRKTMTNLDSILKSGDITLPAKVHIVKAVSFPIVTYGCEGRLGTEELIFSNSTSGYFPVSKFFASGSQRIGASASDLPKNIQD